MNGRADVPRQSRRPRLVHRRPPITLAAMQVDYQMPSLIRRIPIEARWRLQTSWVRRRWIARRHRTVSPSDVLLASYPKSGNTWLRHLLTNLVTGDPTPWRGGLDRVSNLVGRHLDLPPVTGSGGRLVKTHEPYDPSYRRAIWLVRDGRDVAVSEFHFRRAYSRDFYRYRGRFDQFLDAFLAGNSCGYGNWSQHAESWLDAKESGRCEVLHVPFESFKTDTSRWLAEIAEFIDLDVSPERISEAIEDCSIDSMRKKEADYWASQGQPNRKFIRGGKTGGWRDHFTPATEQKFWDVMGAAMTRLGYERQPLDASGSATTSI